MVGTISIKVNAAKPECPLPPCFTIKGSPSSIRIMDVPRAIGEWNITSVKLVMKYPNNITVAKEAVRVGNVWVATVEGCQTVGKVSNGYEIMADGTDEDENPVEGYILGRGALFVLDDDTDISRMVGKTTMRYLDDIPASPAKGDVVIVNGAMKIYDGEEWFSFDLRDYYTKAEIDEKVDEIDSSISALGDEIPTKTSDLENDSGYITSADIPPIPTKTSDLVNDSGFLTSTSSTITELESSVSQLESSMTELESSMTSLESSMSELDSTVSELDGQAVKYATSEKVNVVLNSQGHPMTLQINDAANVGDARVIFGSTNRNHISKNSLTIGVPENGETAQHMGDTHVQLGGTQNDAYVLIGQGVTLFSSKEKGKTKMFMDDDRIFVTTPATVEEGQTLKAIKVANENALSGRSAKKAGEMTTRDEPQNWHWEYVSADLPEKTSWRTWEYKPIGLRFKANQSNSTISMNAIGNAPSVSLEYSQDDGATWSDFIVSSTGVEGTTVTLANVGDEMLLRAKTTNGAFASDWDARNTFAMTGDISISGNFYYLLDKEPATSATLPRYAFLRLFHHTSGRFNIEGVYPLNWGLERACYTQMFNASGLYGKVPENLLPATSLQPLCYSGMFIMTNIFNAPELPATTLAEACYGILFDRCPSLNSIKIAYTGNFSGDDVPNEAFHNWVNELTEGGTLYYNGSDTTTGASAIPTGWTVQTF